MENLDEYNLTQIIRSLTKIKTYKGYGKDRTFIDLEPKVIQRINNFDIHSLSHIMHAYGFREQGNPELHKKFMARLQKQDELMSYQTLSNMIYYLLFTDNKDEEIWTKVIQNTLQNNGYIPVTHYLPFKMSRYYLAHHFPELDIRDYYDKFFYPERYYNARRSEFVFIEDTYQLDFIKYLFNRHFVFSSPFQAFHNCFILRHCFPAQKIAVNIFSEHECIQPENRISARQKLDGKIMAYEGWEVLNMSQKEFDNMNSADRDTLFRDWFNQAKEKQIEKGVIPREKPQYV